MEEKEKIHESNIGTKLKELRKERGITLQKAGNAIGVSASYIHRLETSQRKNPSLHVIEGLSEFYEVPTSVFFEKKTDSPISHFQNAYLSLTGALEKVKQAENDLDVSLESVKEELQLAKEHLMNLRSFL